MAKITDIFGSLPVIETERMFLRKMTLDDAEDLFEYASDPEVAKYVLWEQHRSIEDSKRYLRYMTEKYGKGEVSEWGIEHRQDAKFIGSCGYIWWDTFHFRAEIGYALSRVYWNKGLMTEAVREVIRFGFEKMCLNRIEARCMPGNDASERVLQKLGMRFEGVMKKQAFTAGSFHDLKMYAVLKGEFQSVKEKRDGARRQSRPL